MPETGGGGIGGGGTGGGGSGGQGGNKTMMGHMENYIIGKDFEAYVDRFTNFLELKNVR
jgi:hypothetical protein